MSEYLVTILCVSAGTAVLGILPSEEKMKKSVQLALSLLLLAAVVLPLPSLLADLPRDYGGYLEGLEGESVAGGEYLEGEMLSAVADGIAEHLAGRYGIPRGAIAVVAEGDIVDRTVILSRVVLSLAPAAQTADVRGMIHYVEENTGAECEVIYLEE